MLVSIITPSSDSEKFISDTIQSVLNQTYKNWEMIIVDDCSPDNSNEIIEKYCKKDNRIKLEKNIGPAIARNRGIKEANERYIAFLDSDDIWLANKLETQIKFMQQENVSLCYSFYFLIDENSKEIVKFPIAKEKVNYKDLLKTCIIGNLTAIYYSKKIGKVYMENVDHEDYTLWLKILKKIDFAQCIKAPLAKYKNNVYIIDEVAENELFSFYMKADIFVNPSLFEGFCRTPVEAQYHMLPVVSTKKGALKEILNDSCLYVSDPYSIEEYNEKISLLVSNNILKEEMIKRGLRNVKRFSIDILGKKLSLLLER